MKNAKTEIIQTERANKLKYYCTLAQKQNDSGIMFNERLFFMLSMHHIGYISTVKQTDKPEDLDFQKSKVTVLLTNIKSLSINQKDLNIKFNMIQTSKITERIWIIRFSSQSMTKRWYDLIQRQKVNSTKIKPEEDFKQEIKIQQELQKIEKEKKQLELVSKNMQMTQNIKIEKETKEVGTNISPKNQEFPRNKSKVNNYQEQLAKIVNEGSSRAFDFQNSSPEKIESKRLLTNRTEDKKQENTSIRSQPPYKRAEMLQRKYQDRSLQQSKKSNSDNKNSHQTTPIKSSQTPSRPNLLLNGKAINEGDIDDEKSEKLSNKKYYDGSGGKYTGFMGKDYYKETQNLVKSSDINEEMNMKQNFMRLGRQNDGIKQSKVNQHKDGRNIHKYVFPSKQTQGSMPWTYKYIKYNHFIFQQFKVQTQKIMVEIIEDINKSLDLQKLKPKLIKNNIMYYQIRDIEVKIALIGLEGMQIQGEDNQQVKICSKNAIKMIQNEFNNFNALYEHLRNNTKLRVPLVSLCQYQGFIALFKIHSKNVNKLIKAQQIEEQMQSLRYRSKIDWNFTHSINKVVIQLDDTYYDSLKKQEDSQIDFRLYFIQQIDDYLLPDLITDQPSSKKLILRKQLIQNFSTDMLLKTENGAENYGSDKQNKGQLQRLSRQILKISSQAIIELQSMSIIFMSSKELSDYFHSKGINLRYIGHIYQHLKTTFQKRILMTEMAARSCKLLLRKTIQDNFLDQYKKDGQVDLLFKLCDFFNCVFGNTYETAQIWKVLSFHSQRYYGIPLNFNQIDRWFFIISVVQNCRLKVNWERITTDEAFTSNQFFNSSNLFGLEFKHKFYKPLYSQQYNIATRIIESEQNHKGFKSLVLSLNLNKQQIPIHLKSIKLQLKKYLSFFVSPAKVYEGEYSHLKLYQFCERCPARLYFQIMLIELKWNLKLKNTQSYISNCDNFIKTITKFYGQFHPIFSQLYQLFSAYHLTNSQFEDAITFAKSSLVNILKICGINHQKTSQSYYHLALCYIKANMQEQAIAHIKKSKQYFESNSKMESLIYSVMCLKLSLLYLNQNLIEDSLLEATKTLKILQVLQKRQQKYFQDEITECFQVLTRCHQILQDKKSLRELATKCVVRLKYIDNFKNLQKMLKIAVYAKFSKLDSVVASCYIDVITLISVYVTDYNYQKAGELLKIRLSDDSLFSNLKVYLQKIQSIKTHIIERQILKTWTGFTEIYPRETVKDFVSMTAEMMVFLGQGFIIGTLRQAL